MAIPTKHVAGRRALHFNSYQALLDEVHALAGKPTRCLGNWSLGQICQHLAKAMNMALDGVEFKAPWYVRIVARMMKNRILSRPMSPGFQLPKPAAAILPDDTDHGEGIAALEKACARMQTEPQRHPHPALGPLTREEWDRLQFLHAAMHLSFIVPA